MKKLLVLFIGLVLTLSLVACDGKDDKPDNSSAGKDNNDSGGIELPIVDVDFN
jgi:hypothetical protein